MRGTQAFQYTEPKLRGFVAPCENLQPESRSTQKLSTTYFSHGGAETRRPFQCTETFLVHRTQAFQCTDPKLRNARNPSSVASWLRVKTFILIAASLRN